MILINPTDDDLNAAFAEKVAEWKCEMINGAWGGDVDVPAPVWTSPKGEVSTAYFIPKFTHSFDLTLPYLDSVLSSGGFWRITSNPAGVSCVINYEQGPIANTPARAAVIALLRTHGVEV